MNLHIESDGTGLYTHVYEDDGSFMGGVQSIGWGLEDPFGETFLVVERVKLRNKQDVLPGESHAVRHPDGSLARERIAIRRPEATLFVSGEATVEDIPQ